MSARRARPGAKGPLSPEEPPTKPLEPAAEGTAPPTPSVAPVQVVGIGASAGGLDALTRLLQHIPVNSGLAYVIVQHLHPDHESLLPQILQRASLIPVLGVEDGMPIQADHVYVITPNTTMTVRDGHLQLVARAKGHTLHLPIDAFLRSLAEARGSDAVGIVLSGAGSDGALGIEAIKEAGGITIAQDGASAAYPSMPAHAVSTGAVDFVLSPEQIAEHLVRIGAHLSTEPAVGMATDVDGRADENAELQNILLLLQKRSGVDFHHYRRGTVHRRILRRMLVHQHSTRSGYLAYLRKEPAELDDLFQDLLIGVTSFFRDPEVFEALQNTALPELIRGHDPDAPIRVWVAGCASGEEAYSLAIVLIECLERAALQIPIQIFGTDLSEPSIAKARAGVYPPSIAEVVSPERLKRFFVAEQGGYRIAKTVRDVCVFSRQNILRDPPFSHLDLVSCRNVLIYLEPTLQQRVFPVFHYALEPNGLLLLGNAESVTTAADLFRPLVKRLKIYGRRATAGRILDVDFLASTTLGHVRDGQQRQPPIPPVVVSAADVVLGEGDRVLLAHFSPPGVIVDDRMEILHFRGRTGDFFEHSHGAATLKLLKLARPELVTPLRAAIRKAVATDRPIREEFISIVEEGHTRRVSIDVLPFRLAPNSARFFHVLFREEARRDIGVAQAGVADSGDQRNRQAAHRDAAELRELREGLVEAQRDLESLGEEHDAAIEELRAANEEIQSSNEELQSTNEELETTKEEVQSTNEELLTINEELRDRNRDLGTFSNDLSNVLSSTTIPIVLVGRDLCIRRFTPATDRVMRVIPTDVSRPLRDIKLRVPLPDLESQIGQVIETSAVNEQEFQDEDGRWWALTIRPYQTLDSRVDGAVLVFADIDVSKRYARHVEEENSRQRETIGVSEDLRATADQQRDLAESASTEKDTFLARMSHDLRTPLNAITGYTDLLEIGVHGPVNDAQLADLARIKLSSRHLLSLINDILNFAKLEGSQLEFRVGTVELAPMIKEIEQLLSLQVTTQSLKFIRGTCDVSVRADSDRLRQILLNLASNAIKFTEPGGRIGITCDAHNQVAKVVVWDTGIGIPSEQHQHIFDPFVQLDRLPGLRVADGVGLGLAISRRLARAMHGDLTVESGVGQGTRMTLSLPLARAELGSNELGSNELGSNE